MSKLLSLFLLIFFVSCATPRTAAIKERTTFFPATDKGTYYIVKEGDTLWRISKRYGVGVNTLLKKNRLASAQNLKAGQKIFIPRSHYTKTTSLFSWPIKGEVINFFGENVDNTVNKGLNIKADSIDRKVNAASEGHVVFCDNLKGWGKTIILKHGLNFYTIYANLDNTTVVEGNFTKKGQVIGRVASGKDGNYILHFEIRKNHIPQDPLRYMN